MHAITNDEEGGSRISDYRGEDTAADAEAVLPRNFSETLDTREQATERFVVMKNSTWYKGLTALAVCTLLAPTLGSAKDLVQQGRSTFPSLIPFDASQGEYPEGVAVDKVGNVFVSIGGEHGPPRSDLEVHSVGREVVAR